VSEDKTRRFRAHDAPMPEAIRQTAGCSELPVDHVTHMPGLDPYFYF
jgi:hypothetical protein